MYTLKQLAYVLNSPVACDLSFNRVCLDSRQVQAGDVFFAIQGDVHDGHAFIEQAERNQAQALVVNRLVHSSLPQIVVPDTLVALGQWACWHRLQFTCPVVAITGSNGKTSVKEMTAHILSQFGPVLATPGNFNNEVGLPLTLLQMNAEHRFVVVELGARHLGDIAYLSAWAKPSVALVNNVGPAHIEIFGSVDAVAQAKGEIYETLARGSVAVVNLDEPYVSSWKALLQDKPVISFSLENTADIMAKKIVNEPEGSQIELQVRQQLYSLHLKIPGRHNVSNALAAIALCVSLNLPVKEIIQALSSFQGVERRLQRKAACQGAYILDDSYNANPKSTEAAVDVLSSQPGIKIFVMGDMLELGAQASQLHRGIGEYAKNKSIDNLLTLGSLSENATLGFGTGAQHFQSKESLLAVLKPLLQKETTVLVKGSNGMRMWELASAIEINEG
jgi:UDP-N-acetylmuramoyl-tripeptide--D-alanyl-D-alanine ligase